MHGKDGNDWSGWSMVLSADGTTLAVGATQYDYPLSTGPGYVRVFRYNGRTDDWNQLGQQLDGENPYGQFGQSVALSADGRTLSTSVSPSR